MSQNGKRARARHKPAPRQSVPKENPWLKQDFDSFSNVQSVETWNSGGRIMLDIVTLRSGTVLVIGGDGVTVYPDRHEFELANETGDARISGNISFDTQEV